MLFWIWNKPSINFFKSDFSNILTTRITEEILIVAYSSQKLVPMLMHKVSLYFSLLS